MPTGSKILSKLGSGIVIVLLTCLIWVYADQVTSTEIEETIPLQVLPAADSEVFVEVSGSGTPRFRVTLAGPRDALDSLKKALNSARFRPVMYIQPEDPDAETVTRNAREVIAGAMHEQFPRVSVRQVSPETITVKIDRQIEVVLPVQVKTGTIETSPPVCKPDTVEVTIRRSVYNSLPEQDKYATVDIEQQLSTRIDDTEVDDEFPVQQSVGGHPVETDPTRVRVQLRIKRKLKTRTIRIPSTQVNVFGPPELFSQYRVEVQDEAIDVEVLGPPDVVDDLTAGDLGPYITVDKDDMLRSWGTHLPRVVKFLSPGPGVTLAAGQRPQVRFKLVRLAETEAPTP